MISPEEADKLANYYDYPSDEGAFRFKDKPFTGRLGLASVSENTLLRLAFHDCLPYKDGTGGCDGCLNWAGMGFRYKNFRMLGDLEEHRDPFWHYTPEETTHGGNNGLSRMVDALEKLYTTVNWPYTYTGPQPAISLREGGKSRADLWAFAAWVALERTIERANRACDLDYHARQQITLLEGRDKCEMKLTKPLKFRTGRKDCKTGEDRKYVTQEHELHPNPWGDGRHLVDYGREAFRMDPEHWMALQAIHGAAHGVGMNIKYTWFGPGYISNVYFKRIANKPTYQIGTGGGGLSFLAWVGEGSSQTYVRNIAIGDQNGQPVAMTGWRTSCFYHFNTTEGGPCMMRPMNPSSWDAPNPKDLAHPKCVEDWRAGGLESWNGNNFTGECRIKRSQRGCSEAYCGTNEHGQRVLLKSGQTKQWPKVEGPWAEHQDDATERRNRHAQSWNNEFAFPWEVGMY